MYQLNIENLKFIKNKLAFKIRTALNNKVPFNITSRTNFPELPKKNNK